MLNQIFHTLSACVCFFYHLFISNDKKKNHIFNDFIQCLTFMHFDFINKSKFNCISEFSFQVNVAQINLLKKKNKKKNKENKMFSWLELLQRRPVYYMYCECFSCDANWFQTVQQITDCPRCRSSRVVTRVISGK